MRPWRELVLTQSRETKGVFCYTRFMDTKDLDIVYFVKDGHINEELRFSIRSVCKNMKYRRIWIFGGNVKGINPDVHVRVNQKGKTKWDRVRNMYKMVCENKEVSDNFIMFHDDFYVMKPTDHITPLYRCSLEDHIKILEPTEPTEYSKLLRRCKKALENGSMVRGDMALSYEIHTPFIFNKEKLLAVLETFPDMHCIRTIYGNLYYYGQSEQSKDVKVFNSKPSFDYKNTQFLSTDDGVVSVNNDVWQYIRKSFKHCKYED